MTRRRLSMLSLLLGLFGLLVLSYFYPRVEQFEVQGQQHYSETDILSLARLEPGTPFFWVTGWRVNSLIQDPWIEHALIERVWPDKVRLFIRERQAVATDGKAVYAIDGSVLPGAALADHLVKIEGWGPERTQEALELLALLAEFEPKVISYSPEGFDLNFNTTALFTPDLATLKRHWSGLTQQVSGSQQGDKIAIYPWGVSRTHD